MKHNFILALSLMFVTVMAVGQPVKETYQYALKDTDTLRLDRLYNPEKMKEGDSPAMVYMFGGGFAFGSRGGRFDYLTDIGVQVISIDYRLGLKEYGYRPSPPEVRQKATDMALDDLTDAMAYVLAHAAEWGIDASKIMLSGSSAGGLTTLRAIYDICNSGPYSVKFPSDWMPAGYIGYAGGLSLTDKELTWPKKPCPMLFFHGTEDTSVPYEIRRGDYWTYFGPEYITRQLHEMDVPFWFYTEVGADHVMSYKPFSGYNTYEIQTFVEKFVVQGLRLEMRTEEINHDGPSLLPGANR
jgi:poly(3-hydroxybutyrate) depolymerase